MGRRAALLVGISEYGEGFEPLPGSLKDVQAMTDVLKDPKCGAFEVEDLKNCSDTSLESAIEGFFSGQDADNLLLFYFSGHGDLGSGGMSNQQLHLCTMNSRKENGRLIESSAFSAGFLKRQMDLCRAKQIVVILDCCYSGKIADLLTKGEGDIDFDELKASGRVILASSSAAKVALQERDGLSLYTQFLIEGMEGAAYPGQGDWIVARNLHEHADRRFEIERKGSYRPKILAEDTGYDLPIVLAPKPDPQLEYRREVDRIFQELDEELQLGFNGHIEDGLDRGSLETCRARLGLSPEDALAIEEKIQAPYLVRAKKRQDYAEYFRTAVEDGTTPTSKQRRRLTEIWQNLLLGEEEALRIEEAVTRELNLASLPDKPKTIPIQVQKKVSRKIQSKRGQVEITKGKPRIARSQPHLAKIIQKEPRIVRNQPRIAGSKRKEPRIVRSQLRQTLQSETLITNTSDHQLTVASDFKYRKLETFLENQKWVQADEETYHLMLNIVGKSGGQWLSEEDLKTFPCEELKTLDRLWFLHSLGKWGFSVQKCMWEKCGSPIDGADWEKFGDLVGWRKRGNWLKYGHLAFDLHRSLPGELPASLACKRFAMLGWLVGTNSSGLASIFSRSGGCGI